VLAFDLICAGCGGPLRPVAAVIERDSAARVLPHLDLAIVPPACAPLGEEPALTF
jgi:hypothetical protein